jgi:hypothetical protein
MVDREKSSLFRVVRNSLAVSAVVSGPAIAINSHNVSAEALETINNRSAVVRQLSPENSETKFFDQIDEFVETNHGRTLASAILIFSVAQGLYTLQQSAERDKKRKLAEAAAASGMFFSLAGVVFAQSFTDIDPRVPASLLSGYSVFQSAYNIENSFERDKPLRKRAASVTSAGALMTASSTILAETLK